MKKKTVFKIVGGALGGIILVLSVAGFVFYKTTISPILTIYQNGHPTIYSEDDGDIYYCKNDKEMIGVFIKIFMDTYGREQAAAEAQNFTARIMQDWAMLLSEGLDSDLLDMWYPLLLLHTSMTSVEPGYYLLYNKESSECMMLFIQYDKALLKKLGKCKDAVSLDESNFYDFSI